MMASNEFRKDCLLNRWVVIAKDRKKRPIDFALKESGKKEGICPLCPNNEDMTPPAELVYIYSDGVLKREKDQNGICHKNWFVRVIPNLYPVVIPPACNDNLSKENSESRRANGHHEVIIESPKHDEHLGTARIPQIELIIQAYIDRISELSKKSYIKHISIFKNYGYEAGASLHHPHSQLITTPFIPTIPKKEMKVSKKYWTKKCKCIYCDIIKKEAAGARLILDNGNYLVFAPWASINPFEFWILPKNHQSNILKISNTEMNDLAKTMKSCFSGLRFLLNDPPYNYGLHTTINEQITESYHWHLEVYPKLSNWAGFEKSNGIFINTISPEDAAVEMRGIFQKKNNIILD
ncbi:galactose-1-phosphate uridylyltransferase [Candidatus Bathyarchaeota archaeon]|nr:galactose-1-phosphate uridylyltransferase [Candidatus Bathyarchaeota archaeon]